MTLSSSRAALVGLLLGVATKSAAQCASHDRVVMASLSAAYVASAAVGTYLAIRDTLRESPLGMYDEAPVAHSFWLGGGTPLSPGAPWLGLQSLTTVGLASSGRLGTRATRALVVFGGLFSLGQFSEPIVYRTLRHPTAHWSQTLVVISNVVVPATMAIVGARLCR